MERTIFLVDMNAFFIGCEMRRDPSLKGKPSAVAGNPIKRTGIILAANYEARAFGIKTAMTLHQALNLCPHLTVVPPDHDYYSETSEEVMEYLMTFSPLIEQNSIDEAWLDMTGTQHLFGPPLDAAKKIMSDIQSELDLWCSIGISKNKFLAKMASDMKKPLGITVLNDDNLKTMLWPLPVGAIYGIGAKTEEALNTMGIHSVKDLAMSEERKLVLTFGKYGHIMHQHAWGEDEDPLIPRKPSDIKSIGKSVTLSKNISSIDEAKLILMRLADQVATRARSKGKIGHTVQISLKYTDFKVITRQCPVSKTNVAKTIYEAGITLLEKNWDSKKPVRLIGITLTDFESKEFKEQLSLFDLDNSVESTINTSWKDEKVQDAMDTIRKKFGQDKVSFATLLKREDCKENGKK